MNLYNCQDRMSVMDDKSALVNTERIKTLMDGKGWDVTILSEQTGLTYDSVYKIINGKRPKAQARSIALIAQALDVSAAYLMDLVDYPGIPGADEAIVRIAEAAKGMGIQKKVEVLQITRQLAAIESNTDAAIEAVLQGILEKSGEQAYRDARAIFMSILSGA